MKTNILSSNSLLITEIFKSIQGEGHYSGLPCSFIRLTGCNLSCHWCDTTYAYENGTHFDIDDIINTILIHETKLIEITGGEPLLQNNVFFLIKKLHEHGKIILLETNGSITIKEVPNYVHIIMDIKTPYSNGYSKNCFENLSYLKKSDEIKIVIENYRDFEWSMTICDSYDLHNLVEKPIILQPVFNLLSPMILAKWIIESRKFFKLGIQLHKYVFGDNIQGV